MEKPSQPSLLVSRSEAEKRIQAQIEKGMKLLQTVIASREDWERARIEKEKWSDYNTPQAGSTPINPTLDDLRNSLTAEIKNYIGRLESISEKLKLIPEAPRLTNKNTRNLFGSTKNQYLENRNELYQLLCNHFDENELRDLCFRLDVDYESLQGTGKGNKARDLITYLERRSLIPQLIQVGNVIRPDIDWTGVNTQAFENTSAPFNLNPKAHRVNWHVVLITSSALILVSSILWFILEPGFEPLIGLIAGLSGFIAYKNGISKRLDFLFSIILIILFASGLIFIFIDDPKFDGSRLFTATSLANNPGNCPIITELLTQRDLIRVNEPIQVKIYTTNANEIPLIYSWRASNGIMSPGLGSFLSTSTYIAPQAPVNDTISVIIEAPNTDCEPERRDIAIKVFPAGTIYTSTSNATPEFYATPLPSVPAVIFTDYTIQEGDTLFSITNRLDTSISLLADHKLSQADLLPGSVIKLPVINPAYCPGRRPYVVEEGDTAFSIATRFNISAQELQAINNLDSNFTVFLGMILCVP